MIPEYVSNFVKNPDEAFARLKNELDWERRDTAPRCEYYCNDTNVPYTYGSGRGVRTYYPKPYHEMITTIRKRLEKHCGCRFDVCFLNMYLNQRDHLGWHADDSPEMDPTRPVVSVSLGAERKIWFRTIGGGKDAPVQKVLLEHGSACIMPAGFQQTHLHRIPKASFQCGERISLTFRGYISV